MTCLYYFLNPLTTEKLQKTVIYIGNMYFRSPGTYSTTVTKQVIMSFSKRHSQLSFISMIRLFN